MIKLSVKSLRYSNPWLPVFLIIDNDNYSMFLNSNDNLFSFFDNVIFKKTPQGSDSFKSRFLKTKLGLIIDFPFVFLDSDTLIRKDIIHVFDYDFDLACVLNHNRDNCNEQIFDRDLSIFKKMDWTFDSKGYYNSGVIFSKNNNIVKKLYKKWHDLWLNSYSETRLSIDQPALYHALNQVDCSVYKLPFQYNAQIKARFWFHYYHTKNDWDAIVWHYFGSMGIFPIFTSIELLVYSIKEKGKLNESKFIKILKNKSPWRKECMMDQFMIWRINTISKISGFYISWLSGERLKAISTKIKSIFF